MDIQKCNEYCKSLTLSKILLLLDTELKQKNSKIKLDIPPTGDIHIQLHDGNTITMKLVVVNNTYKTIAYMDMAYIEELYRQMWSLKVSAIVTWKQYVAANKDLVAQISDVLGYPLDHLQYQSDNLGTLYFSDQSSLALGIYID